MDDRPMRIEEYLAMGERCRRLETENLRLAAEVKRLKAEPITFRWSDELFRAKLALWLGVMGFSIYEALRWCLVQR
jgi:hypothetical protein